MSICLYIYNRNDRFGFRWTRARASVWVVQARAYWMSNRMCECVHVCVQCGRIPAHGTRNYDGWTMQNIHSIISIRHLRSSSEGPAGWMDGIGMQLQRTILLGRWCFVNCTRSTCLMRCQWPAYFLIHCVGGKRHHPQSIDASIDASSGAYSTQRARFDCVELAILRIKWRSHSLQIATTSLIRRPKTEGHNSSIAY